MAEPVENKTQTPNGAPSAAEPKRPPERDDSVFSITVGQIYDGPLDLLLDLVRKQDIDIYDIPIAKITRQYLTYTEHIKTIDVDVAAEFIYMASLLIHIKSKMLLAARSRRSRRCGRRSAHGARQSPAGARALQDCGADALAEAADRRCGAQQPVAEGISRRRRRRTGAGRRRHRPGEDFPRDPGSRQSKPTLRRRRRGGYGRPDDRLRAPAALAGRQDRFA